MRSSGGQNKNKIKIKIDSFFKPFLSVFLIWIILFLSKLTMPNLFQLPLPLRLVMIIMCVKSRDGLRD